jgi:predicted nucleic acid-binding Zn ribbon protein
MAYFKKEIMRVFEKIDNNNRCVMCGCVIPEGLQICPNCYKKYKKRKCNNEQ